MNYAVLTAEVQGDPLTLGYSGMTNAEVAASLNAVNRSRVSAVSMRLVIRWATRWDVLYTLEVGANTGPPAVRKLCKGALAMLASSHVPEFDVTDPELQGMMAALVTAGTITQAMADDLVALGTETISRAEELGLPEVNHGHIFHVR